MNTHLDAPTVFIEVLSNVGVLTAYLTFSCSEADVPTADAKLLKFCTRTITYTPKKEGTPVIIPLPVPVDPLSANITERHDGLDVRLSTRTARSTSRMTEEGLNRAQALQGLFSVECGQCNDQLLQDFDASGDHCTPRFTRVMDMPSEYWHELTDCWACHKEDYSKLPGQKAGVVLAQKDVLLVARSYILLHPSNIRMSRLRVAIEDINKNTLRLGRYAPTYCARCSHVVGESLIDDVTEKVIGVKVFRYATRLVVRDGTETKMLSKPFITFFGEDLLDSAEAHGMYRFELNPLDEPHTKLLIWLVNWNVLLSVSGASPVSPAQGSPNLTETSQPALKVLYQAQDASSTSPAWPSQVVVESISVHKELFDQVLKALQLSTSYLPSPKRTMNGFQVGFIVRKT
ncbi:ubiquitin-conjugating enzyme E2-binding protein [Gaertneriomyces semiglobifer]|nr:ubiquitin-conjugating enzyme E2-binding protein [Gaertneriomyces semiglobifer]